MKHLALSSDAIAHARRLRREMTPQERILWRGLRESFPDLHVRRQVPMGPYFADFACHAAKLIIEVDGGQHGEARGMVHDEARTLFLEGEGYRVLRFWNSDVDQNLDGVLTQIAAHVLSAADAAGPHPNPPHMGEGYLELR